MIDLKINGDPTEYGAHSMSLRCPYCRQMGSFSGAKVNDISWTRTEKDQSGRAVAVGMRRAGIRQCPNLSCRGVVFIGVIDNTVHTLPPEVIDFDATNLPARILASLEEAIKSHAAGCYRASALMVRRVLEELCEDKSATGNNLMARLKALGTTVIIPAELLAAADELRLLGNDAAHIEAKTYDQIGPDECAIAIELAKELLKAVYQYTSLVARLQALKKH